MKAGVISNVKRQAIFYPAEAILELWTEAGGLWPDELKNVAEADIVIECLKGVFGLNACSCIKVIVTSSLF